MGTVFNILKPCQVCGGDTSRSVWTGTVVPDGDPEPPTEELCPYCTDGNRFVGAITIPQLDDIMDKCNDIMDK